MPRNDPRPVQLAIIGGGAAGMFAAAVAAEHGVRSVLVERKARLGSKVLMTANGRCNFTKDISADQFLRDLVFPAVDLAGDRELVRFVRSAINDCPPRKIISGFKSLNVPLRRMPDGRMFPADGKAATIVHAFGDLLRDEEVPVLTNCAVKAVRRNPAGHGFIVETSNFDLTAENVLLATGGVSYPKTGSVGDGQNFARSLGHRIVPYRPGLIGLETDDPRVTRLAGRRFEDGRAKVLRPSRDGKGFETLYDYRGEVDCESFGLSGAAVYNVQRFLEHYSPSTSPSPSRSTSTSRSPSPSPPPPLIEVWFDRNRLQFGGLKPRPVKEAIVTIGGVALDEVDPSTMESRLVPGLFFAGEVLDLDGPTGGYNLTLAFATARKAVVSVKSKCRPRSST